MGLFGKSGLQGLPTRVALPLRDIQLRLSQWSYRGPPIHNMGLCSRPGEDPNAWKKFGPGREDDQRPRRWPPRNLISIAIFITRAISEHLDLISGQEHEEDPA